jgi:hypothetical protein
MSVVHPCCPHDGTARTDQHEANDQASDPRSVETPGGPRRTSPDTCKTAAKAVGVRLPPGPLSTNRWCDSRSDRHALEQRLRQAGLTLSVTHALETLKRLQPVEHTWEDTSRTTALVAPTPAD